MLVVEAREGTEGSQNKRQYLVLQTLTEGKFRRFGWSEGTATVKGGRGVILGWLTLE